MSPEQLRGERADQRSDVFAFGVILYEVLSGELAFKRDTPVETGNAILNEEPRALPGSVPVELNQLVGRCLEKIGAKLVTIRPANACGEAYFCRDQAPRRVFRASVAYVVVALALGFPIVVGRAIEKDPGFALAHARLSLVWMYLSDAQRRQGAVEESIRNMERATRLDPLSLFVEDLAYTLTMVRRYQEAEHVVDRVLAFAPDNEIALIDKPRLNKHVLDLMKLYPRTSPGACWPAQSLPVGCARVIQRRWRAPRPGRTIRE